MLDEDKEYTLEEIKAKNKNIIKDIGDKVRNEFRNYSKSGKYPDNLLPYLQAFLMR